MPNVMANYYFAIKKYSVNSKTWLYALNKQFNIHNIKQEIQTPSI